MDESILIITCHKLNENNGGSNCTKGFIHCFAALFDNVSVMYPAIDHYDTTPYVPAKCKMYPCFDNRSRWRKGIDMYRGYVSHLYQYIERHLDDHNYDIIVIDHSVTATSLIRTIKKTGAKIVTLHHNVERDYIKANSKERPVSFRYAYDYYAARSERECLTNSDLNITITEKDALTFQTWYKDKNIHIQRWGAFEYRGIPRKDFPDTEKGHVFAISGSLGFIQSNGPILEFLHTYYPLLLQTYPDCTLVISGSNPSEKLISACAKLPNVQLIPNPSDIEAIIRMADYYICPINTGSGLKLRMMDGLKQGLPIICHQISLAGYEELRDKGYVLPYHDIPTFLSCMDKLKTSTAKRDEVYEAFRTSFSIENGTEKLRDILKNENIINQ